MAENWYVVQNGRRHGPYTGAELKRQAATGHLLPIDLVVKDGMEKPVPAAKVKGLFDSQPATKPPVQPSPITAHEAPRPAPRRPAPEPNRKRMYLLLGGGGLLAVAVVIAVIVAASGRKPTAANGTDSVKSDGGDKSPPARTAGGGRTAPSLRGTDAKIELPDFTTVDYTFDTSKVDYSKGPQGQRLEKKTEDGGNKTWQQYEAPDGKVLFHGPAIQMLGGKKIMEVYFFAGGKHGPHTEWDGDGRMQFTGVMKDGKKHGKWQHWHENGKLQKEEFFLNGFKHGPETNWYKNGAKEFESSFVDGIEHGCHTQWWENGKKANELHIKQGVPHGPATWWDDAGKQLFKLPFRDGKTHYDPASGTVDDFGEVITIVRKVGAFRDGIEAFFGTFGRPASGYSEVPSITVGKEQFWVYRCSDGEASLRCFVTRNDLNRIHSVTIGSVKRK